jgi:hypothetical protein
MSNSFEMSSHPCGNVLNKYYCEIKTSRGQHVVENWLVRICPFSFSVLINESKLHVKLKRTPKGEGGKWCMTCMANCSKTQWKKFGS